MGKGTYVDYVVLISCRYSSEFRYLLFKPMRCKWMLYIVVYEQKATINNFYNIFTNNSALVL